MRALAAVLLVAGCSGSNPASVDGGGDMAGVILTEVGVAACVTVNSCGMAMNGVSQCSADVAGLNNAQIAAFFRANISAKEVTCLAAAAGKCDAAKKCLNGGMTPSVCTGSSSLCTGSVMTSCGAATGSNGQLGTQQFDCMTYGELCVSNMGAISCGLGTCNVPTAPTCAGTALQTCDMNGILHQLDCAIFDSVCVTTGIAHCRGKGAACTTMITDPFRGIRCDGTKLVRCLDGQEAPFDCAGMQTGCFANAKGNPFDCALGNECNPMTFSSTCAGSKLSFCNNGKLATYDCAAVGYKGCDPSMGGRCTL
jgi:hypothetical protein